MTTSWTFDSRRPGPDEHPARYLCRVRRTDACAFEPLIHLHYDLGLDLLNQAPAGGPFRFEVQAGAHSGAPGAAPVAGMALSTSTDDGRTWTPATVTVLGGGRFAVLVRHPRLDRTNGFVSLRAAAWDTAGKRVTQTVERAYALSDTGAG